MTQWLNHPAVQGGIAPFIAGLIVSELFQRLRLSGLAVIAGFCATVYLIADFSFFPLTSVRKIVLTGLGASGLAILLDLLPKGWTFVRYLIAIGAGAVAIWVFWPILSHKGTEETLMYGGGIAVYLAWIAAAMDGLGEKSVHAGSAGWALGLGTGGSVLLGASALLGQLGVAIGAASGAYLLIQMISGEKLSCGRTYTLALSLLCGLIGAAGLLLAKLPWYCLPVLAAIPLAAYIPAPERVALWLQALILSIYTGAVSAAALVLMWRESGGFPV